MSTKFNIYYSTSPNGPWTLANDTPIDREEGLQSYSIQNLVTNTNYYIAVVGGYVTDDQVFHPLLHQPIGPRQIGASGVEIARPPSILARTFSAVKNTNNSLGHEFNIS